MWVSGPKLTKWWDNCLATEPAFRKVHGEIIKGLQVRRRLFAYQLVLLSSGAAGRPGRFT